MHMHDEAVIVHVEMYRKYVVEEISDSLQPSIAQQRDNMHILHLVFRIMSLFGVIPSCITCLRRFATVTHTTEPQCKTLSRSLSAWAIPIAKCYWTWGSSCATGENLVHDDPGVCRHNDTLKWTWLAFLLFSVSPVLLTANRSRLHSGIWP